MSLHENTFHDLSQRVATDFLQTAIVIDDRASFEDEDALVVPTELAIPGYADATASGIPPAVNTIPANVAKQVTTNHDQAHALNVKVLTEAFAEHGLICGFLKPSAEQIKEQNELIDKSLKSARHSDIVILDWQLNGDGGLHAKKIIRALVDTNTKSSRFRMIAIYTGENNLRDILVNIQAELAEPSYMMNEGFLTNGRIHICIFSKYAWENSDFPARVVSEAELPNALVSEFASMIGGLVSNVALASLAALRNSAHSLLLRFQKRMDAPFLSHRALLTYPEDAEGHIVQLISDELYSILCQNNVGEYASLSAIKLWLDQYGENLNLSGKFNMKMTVTDHVNALAKLLEVGCEEASKKSDYFQEFGGKPHKKFATSDFSIEKNKDNLDAEYDLVATTQINYGYPQPVLGLGQILCLIGADAVKTYWMCMQPVCDSVRIDGIRAFLLIPLHDPKADLHSDVIIEVGSDSYKYLKMGKIFEGRLINFHADSDRKVVVAQVLEPTGNKPNFIFTSSDGTVYNYVSQLKDAYSQELSHGLSTDLGRIGVNRPERWRRTND